MVGWGGALGRGGLGDSQAWLALACQPIGGQSSWLACPEEPVWGDRWGPRLETWPATHAPTGCKEVISQRWLRCPSPYWPSPRCSFPRCPPVPGVLRRWGYLLSRDLMAYALAKANRYQAHPQAAPAWFGWVAHGELLYFGQAAAPWEASQRRAASASWRPCRLHCQVVPAGRQAGTLLCGATRSAGMATTRGRQGSGAAQWPA